MRRSRKGLTGLIGGVLLFGALAIGTAYAATQTASGTDSVSGYSLYSAMSATDLGGGSYRGQTYAEALAANIDTLHNLVTAQEWCDFNWSTDYENTVQYNNVSWVDQTSPNVGYATGFFDCTWSQGIRNWGWARWVDSSPAVDHQRVRVPCLNVRIGGAC